MEDNQLKLAIEGGPPARARPLPPNYPGAVVIGEEEVEAAASVLRAQSPFRYYGPDVRYAVQALEDRMIRDLGVPYALAVTSCTAGLVVALKALGIGYGDKVIVPACTFIATAGAVISANAVPVFVDVDDSLNLDPDDLERVIDDEVKAIIAVPILGNPCDMTRIMDIADKHGLYVIEDVAQSCGTTNNRQYAGTIGHIGVFSFQMNKVLTAGEGGAVVTRDPELFERAVRYHDQGMFRDKERFGLTSPDAERAVAGQNYRMSELAGAVLVEQWSKLPGIAGRMRQWCATIRSRLEAALPNIRFRSSVDPEGDIGSNLGIILDSKAAADRFNAALQAENINSYMLYNGVPIYMTPQILYQRTLEKNNFPYDYPFRHPVMYREGLCPQAEDLIGRTIFIPISPILEETDCEEIVSGIIKVMTTIDNEGV